MIYQATQATSTSKKLIVSELNAAVFTLTFGGKTGIVAADLYKCRNSADCLVGAGSCPPVGGEFVKTVRIAFGDTEKYCVICSSWNPDFPYVHPSYPAFYCCSEECALKVAGVQ